MKPSATVVPPNQITTKFVTEINNNQTGKYIFPNLKDDRVLPPLIDAHRSELNLKLNALLFIETNNSAARLNSDDFTISFVVSRDIQGLLQTVFFIEYKIDREGVIQQVDGFNLHMFEVTINDVYKVNEGGNYSVNLKAFQGQELDFSIAEGETIQTVKVFQTNTNPKTSRGTVTTVQSGDD